MEAFREFLEGWLARTRSSQAQLSRDSGVPQNVISRWLGPNPPRPSDVNLHKLAPAVGVPYEDLMRMCGYLPADPNAAPRVPIPVRQRSLDLEYERWMAVMSPRMGEEDADRAFWEPLIRNARTRREDVEALLGAAESADMSDVSSPGAGQTAARRPPPADNTSESPVRDPAALAA